MDVQIFLLSMLTHVAFATGSIIGLAVFLAWCGWFVGRVVKVGDANGWRTYLVMDLWLRELRAPVIVGFGLLALNALAMTYQPRVVISEQNVERQEYLENLPTKVTIKPFVLKHERLKSAQPNTETDLDKAVGAFRKTTKP